LTVADRIVIGVPKGVEPELALGRAQAALIEHAVYWRKRGGPSPSYGNALADQCNRMAASAHVESRP